MIVIYSNHHEAAPLLEDPLEEHNVDRCVRPIYKKIRKVRGKTGWLLRRYGWVFGAPKGDQIGLGHHALQIGAYVYEMTREQGLVGQRLSGDLIWPSSVGEAIIGYTDLSDEDIQLEAIKAQAVSRSQNGGNYHIKHNNCQHFILDLQRRITNINDIETLRKTSTSEEHGPVTYTEATQPSPPISRHDSFASSSEKKLKVRDTIKVRDSTYGPLMAAAMEIYAHQEVKRISCTVNFVTKELPALSCA